MNSKISCLLFNTPFPLFITRGNVYICALLAHIYTEINKIWKYDPWEAPYFYIYTKVIN